MDSMRTRWLGVGWLVGIFMVMSSGMAAAQAVTIDFEAGPWPDGKLGTADDVGLAEGTAIGAEFAPLGVTFSLVTPGSDGVFSTPDDVTKRGDGQRHGGHHRR